MTIKTLEINSKAVQLMKPITNADYIAKTILTNSAWEYVELWLQRKKSTKAKQALFYWCQAHSFFNASECLPIESRPLTSYYCCLNATKALLAIKGPDTIDFNNLSHGITSDRKQWKSNNIKDCQMIFLGSGVLFELSKYLGENANKMSCSIYKLLYNIPCIHRTFSITFQCTELFIPIRDVKFIIDTKHRKGWAQFQVDERYSNGNFLRYVPKRFEQVKYKDDNKYLMRSKKRFDCNIHGDKKAYLQNLSKYHGEMRKDIHYIFGDIRLWYIKKEIPTSSSILNRNSLTLIFAAMHWLSELTRYSRNDLML